MAEDCDTAVLDNVTKMNAMKEMSAQHVPDRCQQRRQMSFGKKAFQRFMDLSQQVFLGHRDLFGPFNIESMRVGFNVDDAFIKAPYHFR